MRGTSTQREAWVIVVLLLAASAVQAAPEWLHHSFRRAVVGADPHNADRMLEQIDELGEMDVDTVVFTGHLWGEAWFESERAACSPRLAVPDVLRTATERCRQLGMRAVVYVGAPLIQVALADRLDWRQRRPDGEPAGDDPACCLLSPFGDWLIAYLAEMAAHAPVDGIWLDGYPQAALACACPYCAERYQADTGQPLPTTGDARDAGLRAYALWWHQQCEAHARRMLARLHAANPDLAVFANCTVGRHTDAWRFTSDGLCRILDGPSVEQFWHVDRKGDPLNAQFAILMLQAAAGGNPTEVFVPLLPHTVDTTTTLPQVETLARNLTVLAHGAVPQPTYGPGRPQPFAGLMGEIRRRQPYLAGARRARWAGIAASTLTGLQYGRADAERLYWEEVKGWLRALTEAHLPVEFIGDRQLAEGELAGLQVLILPATAVLPEEARQQIRGFVQRGGGLVATSVASLADAEGQLGAEFGLADLFGARFQTLERREPLPAFVQIEPRDHPLARGEWVEQALWQQWSALGHRIGSVGLPGAFALVEAQPGRDIAWAYPDGRPAALAGAAGEGRVVYLGPEVGAGYYRNSYPYLRHLMTEATRWAAARPPRDSVHAPLIVQATFFEQPAEAGGTRRVLHLLNEASSTGRASLPAGAMPLREEVIPLGGVRVRFTGPAGRVHLEPEGIELSPTALADGCLEVELPPLGLHAMVVLEP